PLAQQAQLIAGELRLARLLLVEAMDHLARPRHAAVLVAGLELVGGADADHRRLAVIAVERARVLRLLADRGQADAGEALRRRRRRHHALALALHLVGRVDDPRELGRRIAAGDLER